MAIVMLSACSRQPADLHQTLYIFGTLLEVSAYGADPVDFQRAVLHLDQRLQQMHRDWHAWKGEGELMQLNRALAQGQAFTLSTQMGDLLRQGQRYFRQSGGLFNPAIGRLIALWGFHNDELPRGKPPESRQIEALVAAAPGMDDLHIQGARIRSDNPLVQLDLGAYAKGYALNLALDRLRNEGLANVIVNAGGDLCVAGRHGERPWHIGVRHPQGRGVIASLELQDGECVMTSGNYERYREFEGIRYSHIIDPRSGYPVDHVASATVISRQGGLADAAATALSVVGPETWQRIAAQMAVDQVMLVDESGRVYLSPVMQSRIRFEVEPGEVVVSPLPAPVKASQTPPRHG
ncbi:MAG: FAD:protein FMN transferase [Chromatiales bacterium]|jgi:thiamine biosynthesis lipoprotein